MHQGSSVLIPELNGGWSREILAGPSSWPCWECLQQGMWPHAVNRCIPEQEGRVHCDRVGLTEETSRCGLGKVPPTFYRNKEFPGFNHVLSRG